MYTPISLGIGCSCRSLTVLVLEICSHFHWPSRHLYRADLVVLTFPSHMAATNGNIIDPTSDSKLSDSINDVCWPVLKEVVERTGEGIPLPEDEELRRLGGTPCRRVNDNLFSHRLGRLAYNFKEHECQSLSVIFCHNKYWTSTFFLFWGSRFSRWTSVRPSHDWSPQVKMNCTSLYAPAAHLRGERKEGERGGKSSI